MIRRIKEHFVNKHIHIPIIANGGISNAADFEACLKCTGADGVMSSEAVLENPAFFAATAQDPSVYPRRTQVDLTEEYLDLCLQYPGNCMRVVRSHVMKMMHRYFCRHEHLRDMAATAHSYDTFFNVVKVRHIVLISIWCICD
jgi:tRNA-dihydrouridine synthase 1